MRTTSRKLKRLIEEEEKTVSRIAELQDYLRKIREARAKEEDQEIIKSIRSMRLGARDLLGLLTAIREGNLSEELREQLLAAGEDEEEENPSVNETGPDGSGRTPEKAKEGILVADGTDPDNEDGAERAPEREENENDRHHI